MSSIFSVPVPSVFLYLQYFCISSVPVSSEFHSLQRQIEVDLTFAPFLVDGRLPADLLTSATSEQSCLKRSPRVEMPHELRSAVDTSWPHTLEVSLGPKAEQDWQEPSNWSLVNVRLQFTTQCLLCPRHCGLSGRGSFTFVQRDVAPLPLGQLFCVSVTKLT